MANLEKEIRAASIDYQIEHYPMVMGGDAFGEEIRELNVNPAFIAGANWMLEQIKHNDFININAGFEVVHTTPYGCGDGDEASEIAVYTNYLPGEKVKVIIVKENK